MWKVIEAGTPYHSGAAGNGDALYVMEDVEGLDLVANAVSNPPILRTGGSSPMLRACLDFDGVNDALIYRDDTVVTAKALSVFCGASQKALIILFRLRDADANTTVYSNNAIWGDGLGYFGLFARKSGAQIYLQGYNHDGSIDIIEEPISANTDYLAYLRHDGTNLSLDIYWPGANHTIVTPVPSVGTSVMTGNPHFGVTLAQPLDGYIGEKAIYNATTAPAASITNFKDRWIDIPAGGPVIPVFMNQYRQRT